MNTKKKKKMLSIAISLHDDLGEPCSSTWMLKSLCSAHRETFWPCLSVKGYRKEEINTSPPPGFYFTSSPPLCSIKETSTQTLIRWHSRTLRCHLLRCLTFWKKQLIPCLNTSQLLTELGLGNNWRYFMNVNCWGSQKRWYVICLIFNGTVVSITLC